MLTFPLGADAAFLVIEPGNVKRLREGHPLQIFLPNGSSVMIAFTPDMGVFVSKLGLDPQIAEVPKGARTEVKGVKITPEIITKALEESLQFPEVER